MREVKDVKEIKDVVSEDDMILISQLKAAERELFEAREKMNSVVEEELIDYYIYELKALEMKYGFLLKKVKNIC